MRKIIAAFALLVSFWSCQAQETEFSKKTLETKFKDKDNKEIKFSQILDKYKGKTIFIEVWASWCPDCIKGMPFVKELHEVYGSDVIFLNLSCDKTYESWLSGIEKHQVKGEHYLIPDGMKGKFGKSIKLDWIPRYMIIDKNGKIALYKATESTDPKIEETLNK
ncbi:MAG: TlpA family protein disulfide reductase [Flavobacterium sp.]